MARTAAQDEAISRKIRKLMREGLTKDRATAAAFRMFRAGEIKPQAGGVAFFQGGSGSILQGATAGYESQRRRAQRRRRPNRRRKNSR